ncbi:response regulator [Azospirillum melinis]|uniref:Response regulator n=1 Tax=Azospirillum melinis TaxID=328839 RepID=A0ABX2KCK8_9PROT|nr:response regulator [Azospirillum melinis]MBP2306297.1 CheY-like chemotaxis protein [Azospirillum melinis]NUB00237.1 response regulator [Azospirillum melinis]
MVHTLSSRTQPDLGNAHVLVVEDEPFIAYDLVLAVEDAHGSPVGPAATVREALDLIASGEVDAAILDMTLSDGLAGAVLEVLDGKGVPIVLHTATPLPSTLAERFPRVAVYPKPTAVSVLTRHLAKQLRR